MCGIAGILGPGAGEERIGAMRHRQGHRGPDASRSWSGSGVSLGHTRLRVIDTTSRGAQPMWTPDGRWGLVYNGEVYNYRALRRDLDRRGHNFRSRTDSEVVLHAWEEWGREALSRLRGMYAFGIWDRRERRLALARDRLGIKPLYWHRTAEGTFLFASEVRALLASGLVQRRLDRAVLPTFLSQQSAPVPRTLVEGVHMLPPGCRISVPLEEGGSPSPSVSCYWHPLEAADRRRRERGAEEVDTSEMVRGIRSRLRRAVERRLVSDVPLGAFLSGGMDSTALVALADEARDESVRTFTVAFEDETYRDGRYARLVADELETDHCEVRLDRKDLLGRVPRAVASQDHPSGDGINTWIVSHAAREAGLTVALSGLGGDELFGGYPTFRHWRRIDRLGPLIALPLGVRKLVGSLLPVVRPGVEAEKAAALLRTDGSLAEAYPVLRQVFGDRRSGELLSGLSDSRSSGSSVSELLRRDLSRVPRVPSLAGVSYAEMSRYMHDVLLRDTDQMSMAHSLEVRVPFLDYELVEYVLGLPDTVREPTHPPKQFLATALGDSLPEAVANRPKSGFRMPFDRWMRGPLREFCEEGLAATAAHPAFEDTAVREIWNGFMDGEPALTWSRPWLLVALGRWLDREGIE